jgi:hypothetical protein
MLTVLDTWLAIAIAGIATLWRVFGDNHDPAAWRIFSMLIGISLSTYAQTGFLLDETRCRILPLRPRQVVLAGDAAYLGVQLLLTLPLDALAGVAFGMTALAIGRYAAVHRRAQSMRWRFTGGSVLFGSAQIIFGAMLAYAGVIGAAIAAVLWASIFLAGGAGRRAREVAS